MKIVVFTSNAIRHKFVANNLANNTDDILVISECNQNDASQIESNKEEKDPIQGHFEERYQTEARFFHGHDYFRCKALPVLYKEVNLNYVYNVVCNFEPDAIVVYGSWIIKEPLLSILPTGKIINIHLGLSPYYRGSGTNFWPFVNDELEYVGATMIHLDAGIDTGDIITHVRPVIEIDDNVHTIGCKVIKLSVEVVIEILSEMDKGKTLNRVKQWKVENSHFYKKNDFNIDILLKYKKLMDEGLIENYLKRSLKKVKLVSI